MNWKDGVDRRRPPGGYPGVSGDVSKVSVEQLCAIKPPANFEESRSVNPCQRGQLIRFALPRPDPNGDPYSLLIPMLCLAE
jgi:hypothetical protein